MRRSFACFWLLALICSNTPAQEPGASTGRTAFRSS